MRRFSSFLITAIATALPLPTMAATLTVSPDGKSTDGTPAFATVQQAINAAPENSPDPVTIHILPGKYVGAIVVPQTKPHLIFQGDDAEKTILSFNLGATMPGPDGKPLGTSRTPSTRILADDFIAQKITFENTFGDHGQALAIDVAADRDAFDQCRFLGWQDTILANGRGRQYYHHCFITGGVDFIFGKATAVFDACEIRSRRNGYVTAASTDQDTPNGYIFFDCKLTADEGVKPASVYLGRPWRDYADVKFLRCEMGAHIRPVGWSNWTNTHRDTTARYAEFQNTGPGATPESRVPWSKQLSPQEAQNYTILSIVAGADNWHPFSYEEAPKK